MQMFNHGIITGALFMLVGVIYDRAHTRDLDAFGGISARMPLYGGIMLFTTMASLGLPGLSGFWAEFLCFLGTFETMPWIAVAAIAGVVLTAAFLLMMYQKVFMGPLNEKWKDLPDLNAREIFCLVPLMVLMVAFGVWPKPLIGLMDSTLTGLAQSLAESLAR
jgi:NADH-quinone oxidoreductase subunit M